MSSGRPVRMAGEQAVDEPDVIADEETEGEAQESGARYQSLIHPREAMTRKREGQGDGRGDQHHAGNRADTKDKQVEYCPIGDANRAQNEQGNRRGACETVYQADE